MKIKKNKIRAIFYILFFINSFYSISLCMKLKNNELENNYRPEFMEKLIQKRPILNNKDNNINNNQKNNKFSNISSEEKPESILKRVPKNLCKILALQNSKNFPKSIHDNNNFNDFEAFNNFNNNTFEITDTSKTTKEEPEEVLIKKTRQTDGFITPGKQRNPDSI